MALKIAVFSLDDGFVSFGLCVWFVIGFDFVIGVASVLRTLVPLALGARPSPGSVIDWIHYGYDWYVWMLKVFHLLMTNTLEPWNVFYLF